MIPARSGITRYTLGLPVSLFILLLATAPAFRQTENVVNFINQMTALLLVSLGQMFAVLSMGVDLSVGSVMSMTSAILATQSDPVIGVLLALGAAALVGLINGVGVSYANMHPLIMTLSSGTLLQGIALLILEVPGGEIPASIVYFSTGNVAGVPFALAWSALALVCVSLVTQRLRFGTHLYAIGSMERSAYLNGVHTQRVLLGAYVTSSLLAAVAGIYLAARVSMGDPTLGAEFSMNSLAAVALGGVLLTGGIGSALGVLIGVFSIGLISNGLNLVGISPFLRGAVTGLLLLVAVCAQRRRMVGL